MDMFHEVPSVSFLLSCVWYAESESPKSDAAEPSNHTLEQAEQVSPLIHMWDARR